jgi:hypothetical protein
MADHTFYSTENHHNERQIRIVSVGSLVSKPPTKEKRISVKVVMPLSSTINMGAPEWIDEAYLYVGKHGGDKITPDIEFKGYSIDLSVENLFGDDIKTPDCIMRGFEISECGNEETPDVVLSFTVRMPFSKKRWDWLGQYVGEEVWAKFIPGEAGTAFVEENDGTLLDDGENEENSEGDLDPDNEAEGFDPELDTPEKLEYEEKPKLVKKSGPKELAAFHQEEIVKEGKRKTKEVPEPEF